MNKLRLLALLSIVYGSFCIIAFAAQLYSAAWRLDFSRGGEIGRAPPFEVITESNATTVIREANNASFFGPRAAPDPLRVLSSPASIFLLVTGLAFLANGFVLWKFTEHEEKKQSHFEAYSKALPADELALVALLKEAGGAATQKELSVKSGFPPVRTHRLLSRLKTKGVVDVAPFGMTNRVLLK